MYKEEVMLNEKKMDACSTVSSNGSWFPGRLRPEDTGCTDNNSCSGSNRGTCK